MHGKGIAYRDLKPENTLIAENGYPKLIDMGFAKRLYNRRTYSMCGTPDYMAPEIIKRQGHGKGVDYWALGCMIFEMITNTSPFNNGNDPPQVLYSSNLAMVELYPRFKELEHISNFLHRHLPTDAFVIFLRTLTILVLTFRVT